LRINCHFVTSALPDQESDLSKREQKEMAEESQQTFFLLPAPHPVGSNGKNENKRERRLLENLA